MDILALLRQRSLTQRIAAPSIKPRTRSKPAPLSFAQERLWFLEQLEPESSVYNICRASRLLGNLNTSALEAGLNEIVSRHETLRSAFRLVDGRPVQVVQPIQNISIEYVDLRAIPDNERDAEIQRRIKADLDCPFDLSAGFLLRSTLLRAGDQEHVLILMTHHAASDAWSMGILTRELWTLYDAFSDKKASPLRPLPVQYSDYAVWQRDWLQGDLLETQLSYWKEHLKNLPILNLPTDRPRKPRQSFNGARLAITFPEELTSALNEMCHRHAVTPFMTLLAAFQVLLYRYTGQEDFAVGSPISNRRRPEVEGLIGFFVNTLVLRANLSEIPSFKDLLLQTKDICVAANANQDLPFEKLVQELQPERDRSRNPLFQVMFVLQNATRPFTGIPGLRIEPLEVTTRRSPFDLSLFLRERKGKYIGHIEYSTDLYNYDTIERMAAHYHTLLEAVVANPDQPIGTLPNLTEAERHQILIEWNDTATDYPKDKCIHQLFEDQVERTPDAIALEFEHQRITYRELNRRANQLAHYLMTLGIGPEKLVGICVERSIEMVVGLLGILKAGGAYIPLDPAYPEERLSFMLHDAEISVLLTQVDLIENRRWSINNRTDPGITKNGRLKAGNSDSPPSTLHSRLTIICLDRDASLIQQEHAYNPQQPITSSNLAYVIYTSGSIGHPKGVAIEHQNTCNLIYWAKTVYSADDIRCVLASTSICFDLSVFEIFVPLSWGGKIVLAQNALCLRHGLQKSEITLINTVPSVMSALLMTGDLPSTILTVNLAGEPLRPKLVKQLYNLGTVKKVYDLYGPSETTTYSTFAPRAIESRETIGRPVSNTQIYILDSRLEPVAIGARGEIFIAGAGVSRGYLNRPQRTGETFVPNPFRADGSLLYRTGDLGKYLPNGNIEFLGRTDNQVKIRGYRIELGEIEYILNQHPAIRETVVVTRERESSGSKDLIGYIVPMDTSAVLGPELLIPFLSEKLPKYMVPSVFISIDALPLTPSGKIDRNALPAPEARRSALNECFTAPRTEIEELIAQTWREVLKVENIGLHDNFFELGGHSLLVIQILSRVREAFNKDVPLSALLERPTVAGLAAAIEKTVSRTFHDLPPIVPAPRDGPLPLSLNQEHLWRLDRMFPGTHFFNIPYVYRLSGDLNASALEKALHEITRRHEALRTVFAEIDGHPTQIIKEVAELEFPYIDLCDELAGNISETAANLILEERQAPFDLASGPLLRFKLLRLTNTDHLFLVTVHHIISDFWSMEILRRELASLYEAFAARRPPPLPELPTQFVDFAYWERRLLRTSLFENHRSYWKTQIGRTLPLSYDVQDLTKTAIRQISHEVAQFDSRSYLAIKRLAEREQCTPFTVLVAALAVALFDYTANHEVVIATLVANRSTPGSECIIGPLMNTLILRFQVSLQDTITQFLREVRTKIIEAFAHQQFPFEELARMLELDNGFTREVLCQVLLTYRYRNHEVVEHSGLTFAPFELPSSKLNTTLALSTFNLIFRVSATSTELTASVNYTTEVLAAKVRRLTYAFNKVLRLMVTAPNENLSAGLR